MKRFLIVSVALASMALQHTWADTTPEEQIVRSAYAKISLLCSLHSVMGVAAEQNVGHTVDAATITKANEDAVPVFTLSDFEVGNVQNIFNKTWGDYMSYPHLNSYILRIEASGVSVADQDKSEHTWFTLNAGWAPVTLAQSDASADTPEYSSKSMKSVIEQESSGKYSFTGIDSTYNRYAAFQVAIRFHGKTTGKYKAIFLFGHQNATGKSDVVVMDMITQAGVLHDMTLTTSYYPEGLLTSSFRDLPVVRDWLQAHVEPVSSCTSGKRSICCVGERCGFSTTDIAEDLKRPAAPLLAIDR